MLAQSSPTTALIPQLPSSNNSQETLWASTMLTANGCESLIPHKNIFGKKELSSLQKTISPGISLLGSVSPFTSLKYSVTGFGKLPEPNGSTLIISLNPLQGSATILSTIY